MPLQGATPPALGWQAALPSVALKGDIRRNCVQCDFAALSRSWSHPHEVWTVSNGADRIDRLQQAALWFRQNATTRVGWVPNLLAGQSLNASVGWRKYPPKAKLIVDLPCSSTRGEDAAVLRTFFTDRQTGRPLRGGTFLEIGGANGLEQSNTWIFELCLGWRGILVEAHPRFFLQMMRNRPATLNMQFAACPRGSGGWANFSAQRWTGARVIRADEFVGSEGSVQTVPVQCGHLGVHLSHLNVQRLDFLSVDVEGEEFTVLRSLDLTRLTVGVVLVEVRGDGVRAKVLTFLMRRGLRYVGQFKGRGTRANDIIDDVYVNVTHLAVYFPNSAALSPGS